MKNNWEQWINYRLQRKGFGLIKSHTHTHICLFFGKIWIFLEMSQQSQWGVADWACRTLELTSSLHVSTYTFYLRPFEEKVKASLQLGGKYLTQCLLSGLNTSVGHCCISWLWRGDLLQRGMCHSFVCYTPDWHLEYKIKPCHTKVSGLICQGDTRLALMD